MKVTQSRTFSKELKILLLTANYFGPFFKIQITKELYFVVTVNSLKNQLVLSICFILLELLKLNFLKMSRMSGVY